MQCYFLISHTVSECFGEKTILRPKVSQLSGFFCPDVHDMWTGASGRFVLVFVPSRSDVPVQRNGVLRGRQCFSYGRVEKVLFPESIFFRVFICDPRSYGDSDEAQKSAQDPFFTFFKFRLSSMACARKTLKNDVFKFRDAWVKSNLAAIRPPIFFQVAKTMNCMACI
jgi:hypothetical protein